MFDVSSTLVVLNARLPCWLRRTQTKNDGGNRTNIKAVALFRSGTQTLNSGRSLGYRRGNESIIIFNDLFKSLEIYIDARKQHPFTSYPAAKHPKQNKLGVTDLREKPANLFNDTADFFSRNNFANLGFFAKASVPVGTITPCSDNGDKSTQTYVQPLFSPQQMYNSHFFTI